MTNEWIATYVVTGDGCPDEEFADETHAIVRANSRDGAVVLRVERGTAFETGQRVWPTLGLGETRHR